MPAGERLLTERRNLRLREATLLEALATTGGLAELLPMLHDQAISAIEGHGSILLRLDRQRQVLRAISALKTERVPSTTFALRSLPESVLKAQRPIFLQNLPQSMAVIRHFLESEAAVIVPLMSLGEPIGLLVVGCATPPKDEQLVDLSSVGHAFAIALGRDEILRLRRELQPDARFEAESAELRTRLVQSEKLAALGQLVAGIAHELNNPLQGVLGHLELVRESGGLTKSLRRDVQMVYREADRAAKIVRNLLVFAGSRRMVRRQTSINAVLSRVLALRAPARRAAGIEVVRHHSEGLPRIKGDPLLIHQALLNIVLNAEQAIGTSGGRIETRTAINEGSGSPRVLIEVRDTGPGLAPDTLTRIFEPFYTTKDVGKGTGLGLAIAYGIIQEHGGAIAASNHPEGGAVFTVQLPVETE